jgi:hypothetical protein
MSAASTAYSERPSAMDSRTWRSISTLSRSAGSIRAGVTTGRSSTSGGYSPARALRDPIIDEVLVGA